MLHFLIIRPDRMGDAIITQVAIEALAKTIPCAIDVFASDYCYKYYEGNPYIRKVFHCNTEDKKALFKYYKATCANNKYSAIFILQPRRRLQQLAMLNKCKNRYSFYLVYDKRHRSQIFQWIAAVWYKFSFVQFDIYKHEVQNIQRLMEHGLEHMKLPGLAPLPTQCRVYNPLIQMAEKVPISISINISGKPEEQKVMLPSMLTALLLLLIKSAAKISIIALAQDKKIAEEIILLIALDNPWFSPDKVEVIADNDIFAVANKMSSYEYYIGADGGLLHMAASLGIKCVGLYNENVKNIWYPWTEHQVTLSGNPSYTISPVKIMQALIHLGYPGSSGYDR